MIVENLNFRLKLYHFVLFIIEELGGADLKCENATSWPWLSMSLASKYQEPFFPNISSALLSGRQPHSDFS